MGRVSAECAVAYAMIGGWRGNDIITAVAVAMQESDLNTDAANSCCVGLWQVNLKAHGVTSAQMKNPVANAQTAYKIWTAAGGWCTSGSVAKHSCNPWQAYGASHPGRTWQQALQQASNAYASVLAKGIAENVLSGKSSKDILALIGQKGVNCIGQDILSTGLPDGIKNPLDVAGAFVAGFNRAGAWISNPDNLMRIVKVVMGFGIILVGGAALMDKEIGSVAKKVVKVVK
jgi:hypothetical protein